jgi:hypothetical protein
MVDTACCTGKPSLSGDSKDARRLRLPPDLSFDRVHTHSFFFFHAAEESEIKGLAPACSSVPMLYVRTRHFVFCILYFEMDDNVINQPITSNWIMFISFNSKSGQTISLVESINQHFVWHVHRASSFFEKQNKGTTKRERHRRSKLCRMN